MASNLAANGYKIAKSWQYQDNLPELGQNYHEGQNRPLNNNTLRPILMANTPPIQMSSSNQTTPNRNRSAFAGLKRNR